MQADKKQMRELSPASPYMDSTIITKINQMIDQKVGELENKLDLLKTEINTSQSKFINEITKQVSEIKTNVTESKLAIINGVKDIIAPLEKKIENQQTSIGVLTSKLENETQKRLTLEAAYKRKNLRVFNVAESVSNIEHFLMGLFIKLKLPVVLQDIDSIHRTGVKHKSPRPILIRFSSQKAKNAVWNAKDSIEKENLRIGHDIPIEWKLARRVLWPFVNEARALKSLNGQDVNAYLFADKMVINGTTYTANNLHELPQ